jgi:hypothetical protein
VHTTKDDDKKGYSSILRVEIHQNWAAKFNIYSTSSGRENDLVLLGKVINSLVAFLITEITFLFFNNTKPIT